MGHSLQNFIKLDVFNSNSSSQVGLNTNLDFLFYECKKIKIFENISFCNNCYLSFYF